MGLCSAKVQKTQTNSSRNVIQTNYFSKCDNSLAQLRAFKSDRSISTNQIGNLTPKRQGMLIEPQNKSKKPIKRTAWADELIMDNQYRGALKTCISIKKISFSKHYTIVGKSKAISKVKLNNQMVLVENNLSGNIKVAQLTKKDNEGIDFIEGIVKSQLHHPSLLRIYEIFQDGNNYQIIQDFCTGEQLYQNIQKKPYTQQQAALTLKQIIDVVLYLHQHELHHDYLTLQSFQNCDQQNSNHIKLTEFKSIFIKSIPNDNEYIYYLPPEALKIQDQYSQERDVWSIGIILYKMLTGEFPFKGKNTHEIFQSITKYSQFEIIDFSAVPLECQDLIKQLLTINPKQRIKLSQALDHQWFQNNISISENEFNAIVQQLKKKNTFSFLQFCFIQYMIQSLQQDQEQPLYQKFCLFDTNHDSRIDKNDFIQVYLKFNNNIEEVKKQVDLIFKGSVYSSNVGIDFQEFKMIVIDKSKLLTKENLKSTFQILSDIEGYITLQKMISIYPNKKEQLKTHFLNYEQNQMNQQQFVELMCNEI